jgi:protein-tyrosine-phosphatase
MGDEIMTDVRRRVAVFAALADPTRLRIVDLLTLGDLASSEIELLLKLRSNLVAHHLRVLEKAEIVSRTRSEFDKRRSYIGLRTDIFDTLAPSSVERPERVVFVCTANSARSQLAEAIWRKSSDIPAVSAGMNPSPGINAAAVEAAARHGLAIDRAKRPLHVDQVLDENDLVITVCDGAHERMAGRDDLHWSIPDPAPLGTPEAFDSTFAQIAHRIQGLSLRLAHT